MSRKYDFKKFAKDAMSPKEKMIRDKIEFYRKQLEQAKTPAEKR